MVRLVATLTALAVIGCAPAVLPPVSKPVTDLAALLDDTAERALTSELRALQEQTGVEMAVVVTSTPRWSLRGSAARLFSEWSKEGRRVESGVLIVVAPQKYAGRVEVGRAVEPILPEGLTLRIWEQSFQPYFQSGQYQTGVTEGVTRVVQLLRDGHEVTSEERATLDAEANPRLSRWATWPIFGLLIALGAGLFGAGIKGGDRRALMLGSALSGPVLLASLTPILNLPAGLAVGLLIAMLVVGYRSADLNKPVLGSRRRGRKPGRD